MWLSASLLLLLHQSLADSETEDCVIDYGTPENHWEYRLVHDFVEKCNLNMYEPPPSNDTTPLKIRMRFHMKQFKYDSELQEFSTNMLTFFSWRDDRLKWDPKKYDGIETIDIMSSRIWIPAFKLVNSIADDWGMKYLYIPCELYYEGNVRCIAQIAYRVKCGANLNDWPYDAQYCKLEFELYHEIASKFQIEVGPRAVSMFLGAFGSEWDIVDYDQTKDQSSNKQLKLKFKLERHADVLAAIVVFPSLILIALTLSSLFINARSNVRLIVICFSLMSHFYFLSNLAWEIPENTNDPTRLQMYYRGSFIMTSILLVLAFLLKYLCSKELICRNWVTIVNNLVYTKPIKFIVWPRWVVDIKEESSACNNAKEWTNIANVINSFWIVISTIVYVSLYCVYIPKPIPFN